MLYIVLIILTQGIQWCPWWYCWHHIMFIRVSMVSHDQKCHVAPHFKCFNLRNIIVPLTTLGIMWHQHQCHWCQWPEKWCCLSFQLSWPQECSGAFADTIGITWPKSHVTPYLSYIKHRMQWCHWWCWWHPVIMMLVPVALNSQKVILNFISLFKT